MIWCHNSHAAGAHIVVCDDEPDLRDTVAEYLAAHGYDVVTADGGAALRQAMASRPADVVILDIRMPGEDGLSLTRFLREHSDAAVILLTSFDRDRRPRGRAGDRRRGSVAKPVDMRELLARVRAVLRRTGAAERGAAGAGGEHRHLVPFGTCQLDLDAHKLFDDGGAEIAITPMEFRLLKVFAENRGRILNRDQLLELAHDRGWDPFDRSIDIRISRLRKKIEQDPSKPEVIRTIRGVGYIYS